MKDSQEYLLLKKKLKEIKKPLLFGDLSLKSFLDEMLASSIKNEYSDLKVLAYLWKSWLSYKEGDYDESKKFNNKALFLAIEYKMEKFEADILNNRALLLSKRGERNEAITQLFKALKIQTKLGDQQKVIDTCLNIGCQFNEIGDYDNGEIWFLKAQELINNTPDYKNEINAVVNLVAVYLGKKDLDLALDYALQSVEYSKSFKDLGFRAYSHLITSTVYLRRENYKEALKYCASAKKIAAENSFHDMKNKAFIKEAAILYELDRFDEALAILLEYKDKIKSIISVALAYGLLYKIFKKKYDYKNALIYHELWNESKLKNANQQSKNHLASLESKYQNTLKEKEKEILRLQKVEMEQKALRAQLNPHFFFNSLNSINKFIVDNDAENASKFLFKFSSLMRKTLENSEESFITIEEEVAFLNDYLAIEQLRFNNSFQFEIIIDDEIEDDFMKIPTMMLQPYVENSIKHGINGIENGFIKVEFIQEDNFVKCIIEDNGKGRRNNNSDHKSMGTSILESRIKVLNEDTKANYSSKIIDLKNNQDKPLGTRIEFLFPENN